ncbi:MAG: hypothetical protein IJZ42_13325 [Lachnospiraceae bacterium]|nr:hypothetical protein [Lachnospiraceae bacterium]
MAIEGKLNYESVKDMLFDEFGNRRTGHEILVYDKCSDGSWQLNESEKIDTLAGYYFVLDVENEKKIYYRVNDSMLPMNMDFNSPDCHRCYVIGNEIPVTHKITGNEVLAAVTNGFGETYRLHRQDYSDTPSFYTFQDSRGDFHVEHAEHNLFVLLKTLENYYIFNETLSSNIKKMIPEVLEKELTSSDIKILSVEECPDGDFGASIVQYQKGDVISFAFSDMEPQDVLNNPGWAAKDIEIHMALDKKTEWIKWSDVSENYINAVTRYPFEMCFIENNDDEWSEAMSDALWDEICNLGASDTITCGEDGCLVTVYAGAMGDINWNGHSVYGKPCLENVISALLPQEVMPDTSISVNEMKEYGYEWEGMLPMREEAAAKVMESCTVYRLYSDGSEAMIENADELRVHAAQGGLFGVEKGDWKATFEQLNPRKAESNRSLEDKIRTAHSRVSDANEHEHTNKEREF